MLDLSLRTGDAQFYSTSFLISWKEFLSMLFLNSEKAACPQAVINTPVYFCH